MENFIPILTHPLIANKYNPLRRELPDHTSLEYAIAAAKSYGEEMRQPFTYFYLNGVQYRVLDGVIFEMDAGNRPKRKVADYEALGTEPLWGNWRKTITVGTCQDGGISLCSGGVESEG